jgi:NAD(P)-dependent dehydrogenase (short-subunit alcohol dehydrogenase family)
LGAPRGAQLRLGAPLPPTGDMAVRTDVIRIAGEALRAYGTIDILVNNAGWNITQAIDEIQDKDWDYLVELNLSGVMAMTRAIVPSMKQCCWGRVIHISSIMAMASTPQRNGYSATKAALIAMAKASALDLGPYGITVNCIAPGPIATTMPMSILSREQQDALAARTAVGRWGRPDELIGPALLLASDAGSFITGSCIVVDGGATSRIFQASLRSEVCGLIRSYRPAVLSCFPGPFCAHCHGFEWVAPMEVPTVNASGRICYESANQLVE